MARKTTTKRRTSCGRKKCRSKTKTGYGVTDVLNRLGASPRKGGALPK